MPERAYKGLNYFTNSMQHRPSKELKAAKLVQKLPAFYENRWLTTIFSKQPPTEAVSSSPQSKPQFKSLFVLVVVILPSMFL
jgi:hypothetical protein